MKHQPPSPDSLLRLLGGSLEGEEARAWILHHLEVCTECRQRLREEFGVDGAEELAHLTSPAWDLELSRERVRAREAVEELRRLPAEQRWAAIEKEERYQTWGVAEALLADCHDGWVTDLQLALQCARSAVFVLRRLEPDGIPQEAVEELSARAWAYLGNSLRITSDLREAEEAFEKAEEHWIAAGQDPLLEAELLSLKSSLRRDQRRFAEGEELVLRAVALCSEHGHQPLAASTLITYANLLREEGRPEDSLSVAERALFLTDRKNDPRLFFLASWARLQGLVESGRLAEAQARLEPVRRLVREHARPLEKLRWHWYEGRIAGVEGRLGDAEEIFRTVRERYLSLANGYNAALATLDLAAVYLRQRRDAEIKQLAAEMLPIFESRDVRREALAALLLFRHAAEAEVMTGHLLREVRDCLLSSRGRTEPRLWVVE